jgi:hypothetical protein
MRESTVERYLHAQVEAAGGTTRKFKSPGRPHVTDRIVIWPAHKHGQIAPVHFVECKAPGKKPRAGQIREHARLCKLGAQVMVLDTKPKVDAYVESMTR